MNYFYPSLSRVLSCLMLLTMLFPAMDVSGKETLTWKRKKDKMALEYHPEKGKSRLLTDFIFDADYVANYGHRYGSFHKDDKKVPQWLYYTVSRLPGSDELDVSLYAIVVRTDEGVGVINGMGEVIVPYGKYNVIHSLAFSDSASDENEIEFHVWKKGKGYGLMKISTVEKDGRKKLEVEETCAPQYDWMKPVQYAYVHDLASARFRDINKPNEALKFKDGYYWYQIVEKGGKYGIYSIDDHAEIIPPKYDEKSFYPYLAESGYGKYALTLVNTRYGTFYAVAKDGHRALTWKGDDEPFYVEPEKYEYYWNYGSLPNIYDTKDGLVISKDLTKKGEDLKKYYLSLPVGFTNNNAKRVRPLPDELFDLYELPDSSIQTSSDLIYKIGCTDVKAFTDKSGWFSCVSRDGDTLVGYSIPYGPTRLTLLENTAQLRGSGKVVSRDATREVFAMNGFRGLRFKNSDFILPPVYDSISPINKEFTLVSTQSYPGQRYWGLVSAAGVVSPAQYDSIRVADDGKIFFIRHRWPDDSGIYDLIHRMGASSGQFVMTFDPATGTTDYNFNRLLGKYTPGLSSNSARNLYADLDALGTALDFDYLRALNNEAYAVWLAGTESTVDEALRYIKYAKSLSKDERFGNVEDWIYQQKKAFERERAEAERIRLEQQRVEAEARAMEAAAQAEQARQNRAQGWADLAAALGQLAGDINNVVGQYAASKTRNSRSSSAGSYSSSSSQSGSSSEYIPVTVLEVWVPGVGQKAEPTYEKRSMYKRFYGNRWCLFPHKGSSNFHVAAPNNDRKCEHADVSGYKYKAIDPKVIGGKWYYYFD